MISDVLDTLKTFIGKSVVLRYYIGGGREDQTFFIVGTIKNVNDHKLTFVFHPDFLDKYKYPVLETTLFTEFIAIYAIDELDSGKPFEGEKKL